MEQATAGGDAPEQGETGVIKLWIRAFNVTKKEVEGAAMLIYRPIRRALGVYGSFVSQHATTVGVASILVIARNNDWTPDNAMQLSILAALGYNLRVFGPVLIPLALLSCLAPRGRFGPFSR